MSIPQRYRDFARREAHGRSSRYEALADAVADDPLVLAFLDELPPGKHQPNLLFAAACYLLGEPADIGSLRILASDRRAELAEVILTRRTQTNEVARCATLLPAAVTTPPTGSRSSGTATGRWR
jgi:hypothetical protein